MAPAVQPQFTCGHTLLAGSASNALPSQHAFLVALMAKGPQQVSVATNVSLSASVSVGMPSQQLFVVAVLMELVLPSLSL